MRLAGPVIPLVLTLRRKGVRSRLKALRAHYQDAQIKERSVMRATGSEKGSFDSGEVEEVTRSRGDKQIDSPPRSTDPPFPQAILRKTHHRWIQALLEKTIRYKMANPLISG